MTELVLVRHAETVWRADNRYAGRSDIPLTDRGRKQAAALADWAATAGLEDVLTSPLQRARDTARPAAEAARLVPQVDARLAEVDFGHGEGHTREEMQRLFPDALAAFLARPASCPLPGGEPGHRAVDRALPALLEARDAHPDGRVLVVAHQTLLRLLLCALIEVPLDRYRTLFPRLDSTARTIVRPAPQGPAALLCLNTR